MPEPYNSQYRRILGTIELKNVIAVASGSPAAAAYLAEQFEKYLVATRQQDEAGVLSTVQELAKNVQREKGDKVNYWLGKLTRLPTDFENLNRNLGIDAAKTWVRENHGASVVLDLAIDDSANFLRGYVVDGIPVTDSKKMPLLDQLFNGWLAQKNIVSISSTLYEVNSEGELLKDEQGQPKRVKEEKFKALLVDKKEGFSQFCEKMGVKLVIHQHPYPSQEPIVDAKPQTDIPVQSTEKAPETLPESDLPIAPSSGG